MTVAINCRRLGILGVCAGYMRVAVFVCCRFDMESIKWRFVCLN